MTEMTYEQWEETYNPILNPQHNDNNASIQFETYGEDLDFVLQQPTNNIWTELDGDDGVYLVTGYHLTNRISYYVTEVPWTNSEADDYVTICKFVVCDCYNVEDEDEEPDQDCDQCDGNGTYTEWT